ncbi:MAG: aminoacyl-tRNA hydrolase [Bacteroidetes bacterium]|nr:aminoacyl-tRNA hydrolase [Bacteroidota bacterium]
MKYLIVGLGNVGNEYAHTRHNIGFDVVNTFVQKHGGAFRNDRLAYVSEVKWKGKTYVCLLPTTYMNLSGKAVKYWMEKDNIHHENILVIVDDLALPLDQLRLRTAGSDAGHNGLRSIQEVLGSTQYARLRFGIGNDFPKGMQADFVLSKWKPEEEPLVKHKIDAAVAVLESVFQQGFPSVMSQLNQQRYTLP